MAIISDSQIMRPALQIFLRNPMNFVGLKRGSRPPTVGHIQTDGSFSSISRTAVILRTKNHEDYTLCKTYFNHKHSMESEWCSILDGIQYAIKKDEGSIELENDCMPVVKSIIQKKIPNNSLLAFYYTAVFNEIRDLEYIGIRWIPRELNKADELFRI
jgi:ribonuclease HI